MIKFILITKNQNFHLFPTKYFLTKLEKQRNKQNYRKYEPNIATNFRKQTSFTISLNSEEPCRKSQSYFADQNLLRRLI